MGTVWPKCAWSKVLRAHYVRDYVIFSPPNLQYLPTPLYIMTVIDYQYKLLWFIRNVFVGLAIYITYVLQSQKFSPGENFHQHCHPLQLVKISTLTIWQPLPYWQSAKCFCNTKVAGVGNMFSPAKFPATVWRVIFGGAKFRENSKEAFRINFRDCHPSGAAC